jgi:type II secretory pathway component GspD/PulD (secretin)
MKKQSGSGILRRACFAAVAVMMATAVWAQDAAPQPHKRPEDDRAMKIYTLKNATQTNDANEILVALRNIMDPSTKIFLVASRNEIVVRASDADLALAQRIIDELDRPHRSWRLTYTLTERDGTKTVGTRHFAMVVASGQRATLKNGSKVPVLTGSYKPDSSVQEQQFTYLDVGTNLDATLTEFGEGAELKTKVEESGISDEKSTVGLQDPLVRQTVLEDVVTLTPGKPLVLGWVDVPGTSRHTEIEVVMEPVK